MDVAVIPSYFLCNFSKDCFIRVLVYTVGVLLGYVDQHTVIDSMIVRAPSVTSQKARVSNLVHMIPPSMHGSDTCIMETFLLNGI